MRITGLDLSLRKTGVAHIHLELGLLAITCRLAAHPRLGTGHVRLQWLLEEISQHTKTSALVVLEGPARNMSNKAHEMSGLWWLVAHGLWKRGTPYVVVTPTQVKVYALGKGGGPGTDKDDVLAAVIKRYPEVEVAGNDGADALVLAAIGSEYLGRALVPVPRTHSRVIANINWPVAAAELREVVSGGREAEADG